MANPDFRLNLDRRRLLATGAAVATAAIAPGPAPYIERFPPRKIRVLGGIPFADAIKT